jgi:malate dehydrogenase (oxaloacetate-decarboxylating)(NADP+)
MNDPDKLEKLKNDSLEYHRSWPPGKLSIIATKPMATQQDLAMAYSPGVAFACEEIAQDPLMASSMTARGNLVGVISNGTAVLGLGAIGALAAKPVMEGKAVLFKKFAGVDVFDIEIEERDPARFIEIVAGLEATFGGINLEDIKAPECFEIERTLRKRMNIPVFHDDQHGTAIVACTGIFNALRLVKKDIDKVRMVCSGAGAAALACLDLMVSLGLNKENITVVDIKGVVYKGRTEEMDPYKSRYMVDTDARTLDDVIGDADVFLGLSAPRVLKPEMVAKMAKNPIIFALANPTPEIMPEDALAVRPDAIIATGRSDYPNQVNNVLCFPFIFRGALDAGATEINEEMKVACVKALADLTMAEPSDVVKAAYGDEILRFGPKYLIPKPFDPRLIVEVSSAVARAAMNSGVATRPIADFRAYRERLTQFVFKTGTVMKPIFSRAASDPRSIVYAEGEEPRVLQAVQHVVSEGLAKPVLLGRRDVVESEIEALGLTIRDGKDFTLLDPSDNKYLEGNIAEYHRLVGRSGVSVVEARALVTGQNSVQAALLLRRKIVEGVICGTVGRFRRHLGHIQTIVGMAQDISEMSTLVSLILPTGTFFICDTHVTPDPTAKQVAEMTLLAVEEIRRFGIEPKVALLSHSSFGSYDTESAKKMSRARELLEVMAPDLEMDGEMHADAALSERIRRGAYPYSRLTGQANLMVMPNVDAANIAYNLLKMLGGGVHVGPILMGVQMPAHVVTPSITVRGLINMSAVTTVHAQRIQEASATQA